VVRKHDSRTVVGPASIVWLKEPARRYSCAFDANNGSLPWQSPNSDNPFYAPVVTGGRAYNQCGYNNMRAYELQ
jgi:hypothetical protein